MDRLRLIASTPRLPPGLLSWQAWEALRSAPVYCAPIESAQASAVRAAGVPVTALVAATVHDRAVAFRDLARGGATVVWLAGPDGEPDFVRALGGLVAREPAGVELEVVYGSWDPAGARLLDVVAVMDRLRSPGGCPWDAEQTHESLQRYLIEEAYEAYDALVDADPDGLREELGDVLLQIAFHARLAEEYDEEPWNIDDLAGDLVDKLIRRHPHVFADTPAKDPEAVEANWEQIKRAEKGRTSVTQGLARSQPALSLAQALVRRAARAGLPAPTGGAELGAQLLALVTSAAARGQDAEAALRGAADDYADQIRCAEAARTLP